MQSYVIQQVTGQKRLKSDEEVSCAHLTHWQYCLWVCCMLWWSNARPGMWQEVLADVTAMSRSGMAALSIKASAGLLVLTGLPDRVLSVTVVCGVVWQEGMVTCQDEVLSCDAC